MKNNKKTVDTKKAIIIITFAFILCVFSVILCVISMINKTTYAVAQTEIPEKNYK